MASYSGTAVRLDYYDGAGNRVWQVTRNGIDTYTYDGLNVVFEANVTSHSTTLTKRFYAGGMQIAEMVNSTRYTGRCLFVGALWCYRRWNLDRSRNSCLF